jgi:adenosyl cobinamide kinase/adenosyl cobinamide phosphate guanylyltransferase
MIIFIIGGARSGKSRYAQTRALTLCDTPVYVATARAEEVVLMVAGLPMIVKSATES